MPQTSSIIVIEEVISGIGGADKEHSNLPLQKSMLFSFFFVNPSFAILCNIFLGPQSVSGMLPAVPCVLGKEKEKRQCEMVFVIRWNIMEK